MNLDKKIDELIDNLESLKGKTQGVNLDLYEDKIKDGGYVAGAEGRINQAIEDLEQAKFEIEKRN